MMFSYESMDRIADSYIPFIAGISLLLVAQALYQRQWRALAIRVMGLLGVFLIAYGVMFLDNAFKFWPSAGLDYSTHTAVAFALIAFLTANARNLWLPCGGSFLAYLILMLYQRYHTAADIVSTIAVVGMPIIYLSMALVRLERRESISTHADPNSS